jgi:UDP-glucose 6-dehydrogenase
VTKKSSIINKHFHKVVVVGVQNEKNGLYRLDMIVIPNNSFFNNLVSFINQLASIIELLHYQITRVNYLNLHFLTIKQNGNWHLVPAI